MYIIGKGAMIGGISAVVIRIAGAQKCVVMDIHIFSGDLGAISPVFTTVHIKVIRQCIAHFHIAKGFIAAGRISRSGYGMSVIVEHAVTDGTVAFSKANAISQSLHLIMMNITVMDVGTAGSGA
jgi:hypothetical protein